MFVYAEGLYGKDSFAINTVSFKIQIKIQMFPRLCSAKI